MTSAITATRAIANDHWRRRALTTCRSAKAITNVSRYRASGTTHSSGMDATSVEMNVVTLIMSVDGTAASPSQRRRAAQMSSASTLPAPFARERGAGGRGGVGATELF